MFHKRRTTKRITLTDFSEIIWFSTYKSLCFQFRQYTKYQSDANFLRHTYFQYLFNDNQLLYKTHIESANMGWRIFQNSVIVEKSILILIRLLFPESISFLLKGLTSPLYK